MAQSDDIAGIAGSAGCLVLLAAIAIGIFSAFSNDGWSNSLWYGVQYGVGYINVQTDAKPDDCDFMRAPLGRKGCSYKAQVKVYSADGMLVAGENAPKYGTSTGKPIVSYDGGKTWLWYAGTTDPKPKSVRVVWVKE